MSHVSKFLGNSDIKATQDRYAHLTDDAKTLAAADIDPSRAVALRRRVAPFERPCGCAAGLETQLLR